MRWLLGVSAVFLSAVGCADRAGEPAENSSSSASASSSSATAQPMTSVTSAQSAAPSTEARASCQLRMERVRREPARPGAPGLEAARARLFSTAKGEPVVFVESPSAAASPTAEARAIRADLESSNLPAQELLGLLRRLRGRPQLARAVLLHSGYLYAERPGLASALVEILELRDLFDAPTLWIHRGARLRRAQRVGDHYEYAEDPPGQRVGLLLMDRVWADGEQPGLPLHRSVVEAQRQLGFDEMRITHLGQSGVLAELRYGDLWVPSLLSEQEARYEPDCELPPFGSETRLAAARDLALRRRRLLDVEQTAIHAMVQEGLPFDEPKTEEGQQDGNLRPAWRWAYEQGASTYKFNDDEYHVFDSGGRPRVPQVCVDFILDTWERSSGSWWRPRGGPRERIPGLLDFRTYGINNRRSVRNLIEFAWEHPEWFDVYGLQPEERIPFERRDQFTAHLVQHRDRYRPGDVIAILGLRSDNLMHYHSFFIYSSDPVTGVPMQVAANAGRPRIRSLAQEFRSAPKRSLHTRIRPRLEWLEPFLGSAGGESRPAQNSIPPTVL